MKNKIKTEWNFKLFYNSDNDPQIEKDFLFFERAVLAFEKKYRNNDAYLKDGKKLLVACEEYEKLVAMPEGEKPVIYFMTRRDVDANNKFINAKFNEFSEKLNKVSNKIIFFGLKLGKIEKSLQDKFLKDKSLSRFHYFLKKIFENAKYELAEPEEKIINLFHLPSYSMWVNGFSKVFNNQEVKFKGKNIPINEASGMCMSANTKDRRELSRLIYEKMFSLADFSEAEINAVVSGKKISDELRGFKKSYSETIINYGNEDKTIENLVDVVTKNFKISHRFYKIKAKLIGEKKMFYADKVAKVGDLKTKFTYEETIKIIHSAFSKFDPKYAEIFETYVKEGRIDVYPKKGKKNGAYCLATPFVPNLVFLNHVNNFNSVITLGHEMGHSIHTELSKTQPAIYANYPISIAETASTLFENFVFEEVFEKLSPKEKIVALHDKLDNSVVTIFRQMACFNFEKELHETIRKNGYCAKEDIAKIMKKHMQSYLGPVFEMKDIDGYNFISWIHIRNFFYVYAYAFGGLISDSLYAEYKKDKNFKSKIEQFLKAGGSKSPEDIFADIGINIRDPKFFENGLKAIEENIKRLEKLVK